MSLFDFFKPNPNRGKEDTTGSLSPSPSKEFVLGPGYYGAQGLTYVAGFDWTKPSAKCSECHKIRNVEYLYIGTSYPCPECVKKYSEYKKRFRKCK